MTMLVARWGNSLALRLPTAVVKALDLKEGDDVTIDVAGDRHLQLARKPTPAELLQRVRKYRGSLPADFRFDRLEANAR
jgi:antitoxin MazE